MQRGQIIGIVSTLGLPEGDAEVIAEKIALATSLLRSSAAEFLRDNMDARPKAKRVAREIGHLLDDLRGDRMMRLWAEHSAEKHGISIETLEAVLDDMRHGYEDVAAWRRVQGNSPTPLGEFIAAAWRAMEPHGVPMRGAARVIENILTEADHSTSAESIYQTIRNTR